ncbi:MAG: NTP transferase domain-containing protein [Deltaproteobacteria bacterium]|nr:NTP transferase domain-containing protein [Deltaproteobacteria bacterium]
MIQSLDPVRCGIVLAAGGGKRLRPFIRQLAGNDLPKQYNNLIGRRSMLEHTFDRAERLISPEHLFTVVGRDHLRYPEVRSQLANRPRGTVIVQPSDRGTGPGLLLPLMFLSKRYPNSSVVVFPSDHFILDEDVFAAHVALAFCVVNKDPSRIVLLGFVPDRPDPQLGYIVPGEESKDLAQLGVYEIKSFVEKPAVCAARDLVTDGGLWNSMVMAFTTKTFLELACDVVPDLYWAFQRIQAAIGTRAERCMVQDAYQRMNQVDFSKEFLEVLAARNPDSISVLPVRGVFWSDWGTKERVISTLRKTGYLGRLNRIAEEALFRIASEKRVSSIGGDYDVSTRLE